MPHQLVYHMQGRRIVFPLDKAEISIGRDRRNDVVINHPYVSRSHAKLYREGTSWRVVDVGSTYGTQINNLGNTDAALKHGDKVMLHDFPLTFVDTDADDVPRASTPGAKLTASSDVSMQTVYQAAVDYSAVASMSANVEHMQKLLAMVTEASRVVVVGKSLDDTFQKVLDLVFEHLPVQRGFIMLWDDEENDLVVRCVKHVEQEPGRLGGETSEIQFSRTIAEKVVREKVGVLTTDAQTDGRFAAGESIVALGIRSAIAAPLWRGDKVDGLIYVDTALRASAFDKFDLDLLSALGNHLAVAMEQWRLQSSVMEQQIVRRRLERYHSPAVIQRITTSGESGAQLVADERDVTVLFADVVGFTDLCEGMQPREIAELLNRYFTEMTEVVFRYEGTLDKFIGDCLMAVFGAPLEAGDHAGRAVEAALDMRAALNELNEPLPEQARVEFRVGMHSGRVVAGDIGSPRRRDYTVLGSTVNLAARLESTVARPGQIVISETTNDAVKDRYETRFVGEHRPKGFSHDLRCYELIGRKGAGRC